MKVASIIFPHQLFKESPLFLINATIYLVEEHLFFKQYKFHQQKIAFHRASMKSYFDYLQENTNIVVHYIDSISELSDCRKLLNQLKKEGYTAIHYIDPTDNWLQKRMEQTALELKMKTVVHESLLFIATKKDLSTFFSEKKKNYHQTTFYTQQRKKHQILLDKEGKPVGGKWTFDTENRKKYPAKKVPPPVHFPNSNNYYEEAKNYVKTYFSDHFGTLTDYPLYPTNYDDTSIWLDQFLEERFLEFGTYEDAIVAEQVILNHSVLTPMLNVGLISPQEVIKRCLKFSDKNKIPINSTEGFVRQIMGWREFIRGIYETIGSKERTLNYWKFDKKIPASFYTGTTGIIPIDQTIKKVLKTGYCHHIERLMVLGNFMLLCEFDPKEVYRWFMELFIDSYDWVMVPNVYGMSQFADGGLMATKPYISGSNYLMKMSNYKKGEWQATWDGLFWNFMDKHRSFFLSNPRLGMLVRMFDKMPNEKKEIHLINAQNYLSSLTN